MDDRNGQLYPDRESAIADKVPPEHVLEVLVKTIDSGPFKGRKYVVDEQGKLGRRVFDDARSKIP